MPASIRRHLLGRDGGRELGTPLPRVYPTRRATAPGRAEGAGQEPHTLDKRVGCTRALKERGHEDSVTLQGEAGLIKVAGHPNSLFLSDFSDVGQGGVGSSLVQLVCYRGIVECPIMVILAGVGDQERLAARRQIVRPVAREIEAGHHLLNPGGHGRAIEIRCEAPPNAYSR